MARTSRKRPRPGDVVEIPTPAGFAYAQFTHKHTAPPRYGALLRVLPGIFATQPADFATLVQQRERFLVFFPLGAACNRGITRVVAEEQIPLWAYRFPKFISGNRDRSGKVRLWFVWDGETTRPAEALTEEEQRYPIQPGIWNDTLLVERIVNGWKPPTYEELAPNSTLHRTRPRLLLSRERYTSRRAGPRR